MVKKNKSC